jgi:hypothetical protein
VQDWLALRGQRRLGTYRVSPSLQFVLLTRAQAFSALRRCWIGLHYVLGVRLLPALGPEPGLRPANLESVNHDVSAHVHGPQICRMYGSVRPIRAGLHDAGDHRFHV